MYDCCVYGQDHLFINLFTYKNVQRRGTQIFEKKCVHEIFFINKLGKSFDLYAT